MLAVLAALLLAAGDPADHEPDRLPAEAQARYRAALDKTRSGKEAEALDCLGDVLEADPDCYKAWFLTGDLLLRKGDPEGALKAFREVLRVKPGSALGLCRAGMALGELGRPKEAVEEIQKALALDPKLPEARLALAKARLALEMPTEALDALKDLKGPEAADLISAQAAARIQMGDEPKAREVLEKAVKDHPKSALLWFNLGVVRERLNLDKEALQAWETAVKLDPKCLGAHKNLGILRHTRNEFPQAAAHYKAFFEGGGQDDELRQIYDTLKGFIR